MSEFVRGFIAGAALVSVLVTILLIGVKIGMDK